jgi:hypothetical protein
MRTAGVQIVQFAQRPQQASQTHPQPMNDVVIEIAGGYFHRARKNLTQVNLLPPASEENFEISRG